MAILKDAKRNALGNEINDRTSELQNFLTVAENSRTYLSNLVVEMGTDPDYDAADIAEVQNVIDIIDAKFNF